MGGDLKIIPVTAKHPVANAIAQGLLFVDCFCVTGVGLRGGENVGGTDNPRLFLLSGSFSRSTGIRPKSQGPSLIISNSSSSCRCLFPVEVDFEKRGIQ